jgi:hypothetical protein
MAHVRSKTKNTAGPASAALIGIVRLLARQAAGEFVDAQTPDPKAKPDSLPEAQT